MKTLKQVMIIDDSETDRYIAKRNIKKLLFADEVIEMESARKALEYLQSLQGTPGLLPDFIFLDIRMPEIDGFGFLELYDKLPDAIKTSCVIVMLSTSLNPIDHERAKTNPYVNRFLDKPLDREKIKLLNAEINERRAL